MTENGIVILFVLGWGLFAFGWFTFAKWGLDKLFPPDNACLGDNCPASSDTTGDGRGDTFGN